MQNTLGLAVLPAELCTAVAPPLTASNSAGKTITPNSDCFGCSNMGRSPFIPSTRPSNVHLRKVLFLYNGCRLITIYQAEYRIEVCWQCAILNKDEVQCYQ